MEVDNRTFGEKISDAVATFGGSWWFIISGATVIAIWVVINVVPFFNFIKWDSYPFILLNLFLSLIAAFQAPFILMTQKRCEIKQDVMYRSLFLEIKELVEVDLSLEHEIIEKNKSLECQLALMGKELKEVKEILQKLVNEKET